MASQQYAFRAQKSLGLVDGSPNYENISGFLDPGVPVRTFSYSTDGRLFAYTLPAGGVQIFRAEGALFLQELPIANVLELNFSPRGTYLSTWERPVKLEDGAQHKNLRVFSVSTGEELISFTQKSQDGWDLQYTISESHAVRLVAQEIQVYRPTEWDKGIVDKLKVEGATSISLSPGLNPSVAVFVAEKKGAPASIKIYGLLTLGSPPTCQKAFYKADRSQIKWNTLGTQVLLLTQTEVDQSNKSYYGETGLYLLSAAGNFDCRVSLDKEGPIHDFAWSPNSKEFAVVYGYMPAKTTLFDHRVKPLHDFGPAPHNYISFNPHGRLVALGGFGNLAGQISIFDRRTLQKVSTISAAHTSYCSWSPDGRFLLTATLSPRLRVDNGIKIWHCSGPLMHIQLTDELFQVEWRPCPVENVPLFGNTIPPAPTPCESVQRLLGAAAESTGNAKPTVAYRPPGARGLAAPAIFKREDEGGPGTPSRSGSNTPTRGHHAGAGSNHGQDGERRRHVPGAPPPQHGGKDDAERKPKKKKTPREDRGEKKDRDKVNLNGGAKPHAEANGVQLSEEAPATVSAPPPVDPDSSVLPSTTADPIAKKLRNLNKKLKAIEELKEKAKRGEHMEATQLKKIDGEADIRKELAALGNVEP